MNKKPMGFGIIGCGMIAEVHANALKSIEDAELIGASGATQAEAEAFGQKHNIHGFSDTEDLLNCRDIKSVCICTYSGLHKDIALMAAEAGKHMIIEKPLSITPESADEIIRACEKNGVTATVVSQLRYSKAVQEVKKAIEDGKLGKIVLANLYMNYYRNQDYYDKSNWRGTVAMDGGGALMNQGIHGVDILMHLMGKPLSVFGSVKTLSRKIEVEDTAVACLNFKNGALGVISASTAAFPGFGRLLEIHGDRGSIAIREDKIEVWNLQDECRDITLDNSCETAANPAAVKTDGHAAQIRDFINAIHENRTPFISINEGKYAVEIITSVYKSSQTGQKILL